MSPGRIRQPIKSLAYLVLAISVLISCNGSGGRGGDILAGGGIGGTGISIGEISAFGSVIVNDVDFNTEKAEVIVNGESVGIGDSIVRSALAIGMVVRVEGTYPANGTGTAERVIFTSNAKGPVQSITAIDPVIKILSLMGQSVILDDQTRFKNTAFDLLTEGNVLEISGWPDATGQIRATFVSKISDALEPGTELRVKGIVTETNDAQRTFRINQQVVDISKITDPMPAVGRQVIVNGFLDANGILVATELAIEDELGTEDAESVEIEGIVSQVTSPNDFILGTTAVQTDEATSFRGLEPDDIIPGARLRVKGALVNRRLLADEVIEQDKVNIEGEVVNVDVGAKKVMLKGLVGLVINVSALTKIFGDADAIEDIKAGNNVRILGYAMPDNRVEATQIKTKDAQTKKVKLQGPITDIGQPVVTVYNVDVNTNNIPDDGFEIEGEGRISRAEFFEIAAKGDTVSIIGNPAGNSIAWKGIELILE